MRSFDRLGIGLRPREMTGAGPGAYAIVKRDPPELWLATDGEVISRLLALKVVAASDAATFEPAQLVRVRQSLLDERWADAVGEWMAATGVDIDVYEEHVPVWDEHDLDAEAAVFEIRLSWLFAG